MTPSDPTDDAAAGVRSRGGRPRDPGRDAALLDAALEVLAETGYERMTMDLVAARAGAGKATLYRRWASKSALVVDAVAQVGGRPTLADLPDTGTLRGDLLALMTPRDDHEGEHLVGLMGGVASLLSAEPELADAAATALVEPFVASQRLLMLRAQERGEIGPDVDVETIAHVTPALTAFLLVVQRRPLDADLLRRLVDTVVMPAVGLTP